MINQNIQRALENLILWAYANHRWGCTPTEIIYAEAALKVMKDEMISDLICSECEYLGKSFGLTQESHCSKCIRHYELVYMFTQKKEL
jgi:hypothetical protein